MVQPRAHTRHLASCLLLTGLVLGQAGPAEAARFTVNPTQVFLSARATSALLSLRNDSDEPIRFQLSASAWDQAPDGGVTLRDTDDVLFFPQLLTLAPREERKVRVAVTVPPAAGERTYRLFVEELPAAAAGTPGVVRVLTKMGIPIFLQPAVLTTRGELRDLAYDAGRFGFTIANTGSIHFVPEDLQVQALGPDGQPLGQRAVEAWYILSAGTRRFSVDVTGLALERVAALQVRFRLGEVTLTERLDLSSKRR